MAAAVGTIVEANITGGTSVTSSGITTATGDTLFFCSQGDPGVTFNVPSDNKGNTPTVLSGGVLSAGVIQQGVWIEEGATSVGGATHQATFTISAGAGITAWFGNITGALAASLDSASSQNTDGSSPHTTTTGTLAQADNLAVVFVTSNSAANPTTYAESTGFAKIEEEPDGNGFWSGAVFTKSTAATTALTPSVTFTAGGPGDTVLACVVFKSGAAALGPRAYPQLGGGPIGAGPVGLYMRGAQTTVSYELSIDPTSYALTAAAETLSVGRVLNFSPVAYTLTAANETLTVARALSIDPASYALTAAPVTLSVGRALSFNPVSYTITAAPVTLTATRSLSIDPASYVLSTAPISFGIGLGMSIAPAAYALTAAPVTLTATRALSIDPAAYTLTAAAVTLSVGRALSVDAAAYTLTASAQTLTVARALNIEPATYVITAAPVELTYGTAGPVLSIDPVSYLLSLADVTFELGGGGGPGVGTGNFGFEIVTRERRIREVQFKPLLARVLEAKATRHVRPLKERARKRAKAIEVQAAHLVLDDGSEARFDTLLAQWLAQRPVMPPAADPLALFLAQVAFRLEQMNALQQAAAALAAMWEQDDEDALLALLLA